MHSASAIASTLVGLPGGGVREELGEVAARRSVGVTPPRGARGEHGAEGCGREAGGGGSVHRGGRGGDLFGSAAGLLRGVHVGGSLGALRSG